MSFLRRLSRAAVLAAASLALAGCLETTMRGTPPDIPVSLESLDGPPDAMRNRLAALMASEASQRQLRLVAAGSPARYRLRGHLATAPTTGITYVWDVYDEAARRAQRITGDSPARVGALSDPWTGIDEAALQALARRSLDGIAVFLVQSQASPPEEAAGPEAEAAE